MIRAILLGMRLTNTQGLIDQLVEFARPHDEQERRAISAYCSILIILAAAVLLYKILT